MDINGFSLDQEYFGFNHYKRSSKSNLDFMYFTIAEETEAYKKEFRLHTDLVDNIKNSGLPQAEIDKQLKEEEKRFNQEALKIKGGRVVEAAGRASSAFNSLFQKATSALGITNKGGSGEAPVNVSYGDDKSQGGAKNNKKVYWIVGGIAILAVAGFIVYKMRK